MLVKVKLVVISLTAGELYRWVAVKKEKIMTEKIEPGGQKEFLSWRQFWLRSIAVFIPYIVSSHLIVPTPLNINTSDPLKILVYYFMSYLFLYLFMWIIVVGVTAIKRKVNPRLRALPLSHVLASAVPYVLIFCALMIFGQWYALTHAGG